MVTEITLESVDTTTSKEVESSSTSKAVFNTFFNDFKINAFPFYNFWTEDELTNDKQPLSQRSIEDVPRFVKVVWNTAPGIKLENGEHFDFTSRNIEPVLFSRNREKPVTLVKDGITFTPLYLQYYDLEKLTGLIANGWYSAGILETTVDLNFINAGKALRNVDKKLELDEDSFLQNKSFSGISFNEIKTVLNDVNNAKTVNNISGGTAMTTSAGGRQANLRSTNPAAPQIDIKFNIAYQYRQPFTDKLLEFADTLTEQSTESSDTDRKQVRVKFSDTSVGGTVNKSKINLMSSPEHLEMLMAVVPNLSSLEILSKADISGVQNADVVPTQEVTQQPQRPFEYVGYLIEKYERQQSGLFTLTEKIVVPSRDTSFYVDTKIAYGKIYRYRIRAVIRWSRKKNQTDPQNEKYIITFFASDWGSTWAYASCIDNQPPPPPDELTVIPQSGKKRVIVTARLPFNDQKDINKMSILRKVRDNTTGITGDWVIVKSTSNAAASPGNLIFFDTDVEYFQDSGKSYIYAAICESLHGERSVLSEQISAKISSQYYSRGEILNQFVSCAGVSLENSGVFSSNPPMRTKTHLVIKPKPTEIGSNPGNVSLLFTGRYTAGRSEIKASDYLVRVLSLDTGEKRDYSISSSVRSTEPVITSVTGDVIAGKKYIDSLKKTSILNDTSIAEELGEKSDFNPQDRALRGERY